MVLMKKVGEVGDAEGINFFAGEEDVENRFGARHHWAPCWSNDNIVENGTARFCSGPTRTI
jgi:hypothetical protein